MKCNFRVYTKYKKIGDNYYEATYKEYTKDGRLVAKGSEDFSGERLLAPTKQYKVYCYNGRVMHGTAHEGWRMTDCKGTIMMSNNAVAIKVAKILYKNVSRVVRFG